MPLSGAARGGSPAADGCGDLLRLARPPDSAHRVEVRRRARQRQVYYTHVLRNCSAGPLFARRIEGSQAGPSRRGLAAYALLVRRIIMKPRLAWLGLVSLAVVLAGCKVTFHRPPELSPRSLVGYSLVLTNSARSGPWATDRETYHFKSRNEAFNSRLDRARSWSYDKDDHSTATVSVTFLLRNFDHLITTCVLTFDSRHQGTHECKYEEETSTMFREITTPSGSSTGTFRIDEIGQSG